ncbi:pyridoxal phosphate-dependent decarboxylase family protein [Gordonia sp. DT219]|uniref:pyridoxal phosphate-dependent decarboxylase family protein n=1 Tax=Gordonia sp. DT219 TaxID=3416658 RepID=UPI003CF49CF1
MTDSVDRHLEAILDDLTALREHDAPTHGGRVLSYVYDSGLAELDDLARRAAASVASINGLDPTTFPSVAAMERDVIAFAAGLAHGTGREATADVVGLVTSGGTESCLLAVKSARDRWRDRNPASTEVPVVLAPITAHAAFHKAAHYFDLELDLVPVGADLTVSAADLVDRMTGRTALVVVSAPNYPYGLLDPVAEVAPAAAARGIACHVDACIGGWVLPFWASDEPHRAKPLPDWDFRVAGVTSLSMDAHKYGYAPKGASVLLFADRDAKRAAGFVTTRWPGYPVVNPTMLGSRSATSLAAAWAVIRYLGDNGFRALSARTRHATRSLIECVDGITGLRVVGEPAASLFAVCADTTVAADRRVDPHLWSDQVRTLGWVLQPQPGLGPAMPHTTHLTVTPVTADVVGPLCEALVRAADAVRGTPPIDLSDVGDAMPELLVDQPLDSAAAHQILESLGLGGGGEGGTALPDQLAPVMALLGIIPPARAESLLAELLARLNES